MNMKCEEGCLKYILKLKLLDLYIAERLYLFGYNIYEVQI